MKKLKSFKKMSAKATAALLCLATSATCMTLAVPYMSTSPRAEEIDGSQVTITDGVNLADSCDYGKTFKVPANAKVTAPDGSDATPAEGSELVAANQIGNYKVTFEDSGLSYTSRRRVFPQGRLQRCGHPVVRANRQNVYSPRSARLLLRR